MQNRGISSLFFLLFQKAFCRKNPPVSVSEMQDFVPPKQAPSVVFDTGEHDRPTTRVVRGRPNTSRMRTIHQPSRGRGHRQPQGHRKVK